MVSLLQIELGDAPDVPTLKEQGTNVQFRKLERFLWPSKHESDGERRKLLKCWVMFKKLRMGSSKKENAWVNIYNPDSKFVKFLEKQTKEMTGLIKKLGVIKLLK